MMLKKINFFLLCFFFTPLVISEPVEARPPTCKAKGKDSKVADAGKKIMPAAASLVSLLKKDWLGAVYVQVIAEGLYAINHPLEKKINKKRPCGCNGAFPSGHMIMYSSSASFLHYRYGWQYGLPAYLIMLGFSYDRVRCKAHTWGDMIGTAAIVNLITYIITPRYTPDVEYLPPCFSFSCPEEGSLREKALRERNKSPYNHIIPVVQARKGQYTVGLVMRV